MSLWGMPLVLINMVTLPHLISCGKNAIKLPESDAALTMMGLPCRVIREAR